MDAGPGSVKPHLILLPGLPGNGELFDRLNEELMDYFTIETVSYPPAEALGYDQLIDRVTSRIPKEKPYFLLGESFSGPLSIIAGCRHRENLQGLILAATFVTSPMPVWINSLKPFMNTFILDLRPTRFTNRRLMGSKCDEKTRVWINKSMPRLERETLAARIWSVLTVNVREELKSLRVPLLYLAGARDWLVSKKCLDAVWLCRPDVEIKVIDGVHMILQTNPHDSAKAIIDFSGRVMGSE